MKIAGYIHPVVQALGPNFSCGWFEIVAKLLQTLRRDADCDCMMIAGDWPSRWANKTGRGDLLEGIRFAELDEISLYRTLRSLGKLPTALDQLAYEKGGQFDPGLQAITDEVARCTRDFEPDVIISFGIQVDFLAALWPKALRLHIESGPFSRNPYPFSVFFDHLGMYGRSIIGQAGQRLRAHAATDDAVALVSAFRSRNALALDAVDPFRGTDFRTKFDRLVLLPLQVSNYYSFNEQSHYRTQFEYLLDVLSATPPDVGVIVTEYIEWGHILMSYGSAENIPYLQKNFPNLIFFEQFRAYASPSQFLAPRVDGVWSVSSNVGYQALLHNRVLGSPATSHLAGSRTRDNIRWVLRKDQCGGADQQRCSFSVAAGTLPRSGCAVIRWPLAARLLRPTHQRGPGFRRPDGCLRADRGHGSSHGGLGVQGAEIQRSQVHPAAGRSHGRGACGAGRRARGAANARRGAGLAQLAYHRAIAAFLGCAPDLSRSGRENVAGEEPARTGLAPASPDYTLSRRRDRASVPPVLVGETYDIVLTEIAANLNLDQFERYFAGIGKAVNTADRDVS